MLLAIDAGNTNTVFALFKDQETIGVWRMVTNAQHTSDEYAVFLDTMTRGIGGTFADIEGAIVGSVVPEANFQLAKFCRDYLKCEALFVGDPHVHLGIEIKVDNPHEVGADRLINAVASLATYKPPLLLVDFGTATTFDVVDETGAYCGGAIAPGANMSLQALHMAAAKLPRVAIARPRHVIGRGTIEAIQSGIFWGYVGLINGLIDQMQAECGKTFTVVATGGLSALFREAIPAMNYIDPDLTLRGLKMIYERNRNPQKQQKVMN